MSCAASVESLSMRASAQLNRCRRFRPLSRENGLRQPANTKCNKIPGLQESSLTFTFRSAMFGRFSWLIIFAGSTTGSGGQGSWAIRSELFASYQLFYVLVG